MSASIKSIARGVEDQLQAIVRRANLIPGYLNRVVYREYQKGQRKRWETQNSGEDFAGGTWPALDPAYAAWKKKKFSGYPGSGTKMLIRTKRLFDSVVGPSGEHEKIVEQRAIRINSKVPYAHFVDAKRTFTQWSPRFYSRINKDLQDYLIKNILKEVN